MIRSVLIAALVFGITLPARAERLWLVIGASDLSAAVIAQKAKPLAPRAPNSLVVQTGDCGDKQNIFAWVAEIATSAETAQVALPRIREIVKDAYVKRCDVKPGTLLALRITVVDASIADVPRTTVNWQDEDRISSVHPLPDGRIFVIARYFAGTIDDPLEGRRERVILAESSDRRLVLEDNCLTPSPVVMRHGRIAFHCIREQAGDHLIHNVVVFDMAGEKLMEIQHCRNPSWSSERTIFCKAESVGSDGQLKLSTKRTELPSLRESVNP